MVNCVLQSASQNQTCPLDRVWECREETAVANGGFSACTMEEQANIWRHLPAGIRIKACIQHLQLFYSVIGTPYDKWCFFKVIVWSFGYISLFDQRKRWTCRTTLLRTGSLPWCFRINKVKKKKVKMRQLRMSEEDAWSASPYHIISKKPVCNRLASACAGLIELTTDTTRELFCFRRRIGSRWSTHR